MATVPQVGDECKADPFEEGDYILSTITKIEDGYAWANIRISPTEKFCGDLPTKKEDGVWVFTSF